MARLLYFISVLLLSACEQKAQYVSREECIQDRLKDMQTDAAVSALIGTCTAEFRLIELRRELEQTENRFARRRLEVEIATLENEAAN